MAIAIVSVLSDKFSTEPGVLLVKGQVQQMVRKTYNRFPRGLSIIETVIAIVIIGLAVLGTMTLRYQSTLDVRRAEVATAASRVALTLTETWRGLQGSATFNPVVLLSEELPMQLGDGPAEPNGFTPLGDYVVDLANVNYYTTLSYKDVNSSLRALNVTVTWQQGGTAGAVLDDSDKTFGLTTYVER